MRKIFTLLCFVLTTTFFVKADNATFSWVSIGGGAGADYSADVVTDANGNIFTANYFLNTATFNGVTLTGSAKGSGANFDNSLFVSKLSPAKVTLWSIYSNVGVVTPTALATTPGGDLIMTGTIRAVVNTADQTTTANIIDALGTVTTFTGLSSSIVQSFVAKFNANGAIQWAKEFDSGTAKDKAVTTSALAADAKGDVYLTGIYTNTVVLPAETPIILTTNNTAPQAAFITKLDGTTGNEIWYKTSSGSIVSEILSGLVYGDDGFLYAAGIYKNAAIPILVTIGDKSFTPTAGFNLTLIKFDTDGNISYIQSRSNASDTRVKDIFVKNGKVFVGGSLRGDNGGLLFSGANALKSTAAYLNGFTAVFDSNGGSDIWQKAILSSGIVEVYGITIGSDNRLYAFGTYANKTSTSVAGPVDFGNSKTIVDTPTSNTSGDLFLVSYDVSNGTTLEIHSVATSSTYENAKSITSYGNNLYLFGGTNAASISFEKNNTISGRTVSFDFMLLNYTVVNPSTGIISSEASKLPFSYADHSNHLIVVKNAGNVRNARIIDTMGRSIKTASNSNNDVLNINAQGIAAGVYILQLTTSNSQITSQRLIIQ